MSIAPWRSSRPRRYACGVPSIRIERSRPTARRRLESVRDMLLSIAGIALIVLKLTGVIAWSWWWVLSPMWISATFLALLASGLIIAMIVAHWQLRR
jgi:membrane protein YdbS with pleckstrin-like domain